MKELTEVINWRRLDAQTTLSGQPTEDQLLDIKALGVSDVVNLGPHTNKGALEDETRSLSTLGLTYHYIPVDFENPTEEDYRQFCETIESLNGKTIHVHCIYNARVSAFFYRYAKEGKGNSTDEAFALMDGIWRPGGVWAKFIGKDEDASLPNRYKGYEY